MCAKLQVTVMAFTFTFPDVIVVSDLNKNFGDGFGEKMHGSVDLRTPIYPPLRGGKRKCDRVTN